jgi:hypothetical protein
MALWSVFYVNEIRDCLKSDADAGLLIPASSAQPLRETFVRGKATPKLERTGLSQ